ncbi:MAG: anthranilate synthase component I family protein [Chitinophagaceae bacterium]
MDSNFISFPITDFTTTKQQVLSWANQFSTCCFLDNHQYQFNHHTYECMLGAGAKVFLELPAGNALAQLRQFQQHHNGWLFGHLNYDLKNETEELVSAHQDGIGFPDLFFFVPETVILLSQHQLCIAAADAGTANNIFIAITTTAGHTAQPRATPVAFRQRISKAEYIGAVEKLRGHIMRGDCYEVNFCQEFFATETNIDPVAIYHLLSEISPAPFAAFYKTDGRYLLCASPERYLKRQGNHIISQPIKGTRKRNLLDAAADETGRAALYNSTKERAENVMVVDLVRNDLSKICVEGSVQVDELFGIYSFPQVHQMISTVSGTLQPGLSFADMVQQTFPMGSMTGAPKKKVMELIERFETVKRGIFSGAVGYISPGGDFDFNVVIRSILYNQPARYLSYLVGSAITFASSAEEEYEECMVKAAAIKQVFS